MKQQFVVTHTVRQTYIPVLLDSWVTNTFWKYGVEKIASHVFVKT